MSELPTPETVAGLVCDAGESMWGVAFTLVEEAGARRPPSHSRQVRLEVAGAPALAIIVSSDETGGSALGQVMFSCQQTEVSASMIDDSLCELANIVAGQIKSLIAPTHTLGLPTVLTGMQATTTTSETSIARLRIGKGTGTVCVTVAAA